MALTVGTRLGPYEITAPLGSGGMGEVWRATDTNLARQVAIKILPEPFADDPVLAEGTWPTELLMLSRTPRSWMQTVPIARTTMEDSWRGFCC